MSVSKGCLHAGESMQGEAFFGGGPSVEREVVVLVVASVCFGAEGDGNCSGM